MTDDRRSAIGNRQSEEPLPAEICAALEKLDVAALGAANRLDVARLSVGLQDRLKTSQRRNVPTPQRLWKVAAAIAVVIGGALMLGRETNVESASLPVAMDSVDIADSQAVLNVVNEVRSDSTMELAGSVTVEDLSEQELRALLQALENEETL